MISNGDLLCVHNKFATCVNFGEYSSLSGSDHAKPARSQVRGGMPTDDSTYIATLSGVPRCEGSSSLRWSWGRQLPCLSATTSSAEAKRRTGYGWEAGTYSSVESTCQEILCASLQWSYSNNLCTCVPLVFFKYPRSVAVDHRCLVPNADRKPAAATFPHPGMGRTALGPAPCKPRVVWILATPLQVAVSRCEKAVFRRCSAARPSLVLNYTVLSVPS